MIASDHQHPYACRAAFGHRCRHVGAQGIRKREQAHHRVRLNRGVRRRSTGMRGGTRDAQYPESLGGEFHGQRRETGDRCFVQPAQG